MYSALAELRPQLRCRRIDTVRPWHA